MASRHMTVLAADRTELPLLDPSLRNVSVEDIVLLPRLSWPLHGGSHPKMRMWRKQVKR